MVKFSLVVLIFLITTSVSTGQTLLTGKFSNITEDTKLSILINDESVDLDSVIKFSNSGDYALNLSSYVVEPIRGLLTLQFGAKPTDRLFLNLYLAPNYQIQLNADIDTVSGDRTFNSFKMTGVGSSVNKLYLVKPLQDTIDWINKSAEIFIEHNNDVAAGIMQRLDSLLTTEEYDIYAKDWKEIISNDLKYTNLHSFVANYGFNNELNAEMITNFFPLLGFNDLFLEMNDERNLRSRGFRFFLNQLNFLEKNGLLAYPSKYKEQFKRDEFPDLSILNILFAGKVRQYVLEEEFIKKINNLNVVSKIKRVEDRVGVLNDINFKENLNKIIDDRIIKISAIQPGNLVQKNITFINSLNSDTVRLKELHGKIVYIESWASWCGPCKEEIPHLRKLVDYYKDNKNIVFISLAVWNDGQAALRERLKIIKQEKMNWTQLQDVDKNFVEYFKIQAIPHNVILGMSGEIIDNDSLRPSSPDIISYLDKLLEDE